jgi:hypothetical protein
MAGAASKTENGHSQYQDHSPVVACPQSLLQAVRSAVLESFHSGPHGGAEVYGVLFGTHNVDEVRVEEFQAIAFQSAMAGATPLSTDERNAFAAALARTAGESEPETLEPVGWFRAHPHSELGLTQRDLEIANTFFSGAHQVVMILRPSGNLPSLVRFFYRQSDGALKAESPYSEFTVPLAPEGPPAAESPMAQDATTFVAARSSSTALALPGATQPVDEDSALMRLAERPPLPRRRISLFWPGVLAAVAGLVAAMYWLTRPPERLALRVFDTAGQLRIIWDPVLKADSGRLEIVDGDARFSIDLQPEQLRSGSFTYARHTGNVNVRLRVLRQGTEPLAEAASYLGRGDELVEQTPPAAGSASRQVPNPAEALPAAKEKAAELVMNVPVAPPPRVASKFRAPVAGPSRPASQSPDLAPPPMIAQHAQPAVLPPVARLNPPAERPASPAAAPTAAAVPARPPAAPASGRIIWIGRLQKNQEVAITGKSCSSGTLVGELPGKPLKFSISPGDLSSGGIVLYTANPQYANNVVESPGPQNGWNQTVYTWSPKYANDVAVKESPSPQNQWNRLVLQSKNPRISVIVIDWSLVN